MTRTQVQVTLARPLRDLAGRFQRANQQMPRLRRDLMRDEARRFVTLAQREAPKGRTGRFAETIRFRTFDNENKSGFTVSAQEPLSTFIREGTSAHQIPLSRLPYPLRFFWAKGPNGPGVYFYFTVQHPGTQPDDYIERTRAVWISGFEKAGAKLARNWADEIR